MNDDNLITVVSLADKLNVAKQTVFYNAKKLEIDTLKIDNVSYVTIEQANMITERINSNKSSKRDNNTSHSRDNDDTMTQSNDMLNVLLEQLRVKDEQIKQLNNTLDEQQRLLSQQQSLQLQSNEKIKALEIELNEIKEDNTNDYQKEDTNKVDSFYKDLREDNSNTNKKGGLLSRFFK